MESSGLLCGYFNHSSPPYAAPNDPLPDHLVFQGSHFRLTINIVAILETQFFRTINGLFYMAFI